MLPHKKSINHLQSLCHNSSAYLHHYSGVVMTAIPGLYTITKTHSYTCCEKNHIKPMPAQKMTQRKMYSLQPPQVSWHILYIFLTLSSSFDLQTLYIDCSVKLNLLLSASSTLAHPWQNFYHLLSLSTWAALKSKPSPLFYILISTLLLTEFKHR